MTHGDPDERWRLGKAARARVPRSSHGAFTPARTRPDPLDVLAAQDRDRLPDLLPIRYDRMAESPFAFFRGAAAIMAHDLATTPSSGAVAQLCGDAHLANFGLFASPERNLVFDVNDFDETVPGPWEWDVKRLATSLEIAGRDNGFSAVERRSVVEACVAEYRTAMRSFAGMTHLQVWYARADTAELQQRADDLSRAQRQRLEHALGKARSRDSLRELGRITEVVGDRIQIVSDPPLLVPVRDLFDVAVEREVLEDALAKLVREYRRTLQPDRRVLLERYRVVDLARKVVGIGSVGTRCWILLLLGRDARDPLFLQVKEAGRSVLEEHTEAGVYANHGERVVSGQRLMQAVSDIFLGWQRTTGVDGKQRDFYVRQFRDWKGSVDVATMVPDGMRRYGELCGWTLARAHARSGDRIAIAGYLGGGTVFDRAIGEFASCYADQNERDHQQLVVARERGTMRTPLHV